MAHDGAAKRGRAGRNAVPRTLQNIEENVLNIPLEARTSEILYKPMEKHNMRLIRILSAGREKLFIPGS